MNEVVLDTVALRVMAFAHPDGIDILLAALAVPTARLPAEVYNADEDAPLMDADISELARGLRFARRQVAMIPAAQGQRYATWLVNAAQITRHRAVGTLIIDPLTVEELPRREEVQQRFGIGLGESASIVLAERFGALAIFLSSDDFAYRAAQALGIRSFTLLDVLERWVQAQHPPLAVFDDLIEGMRTAKFGLKREFAAGLRVQLMETPE
ncbi:MAG: hypothetical protein ACYDAR_01155 [Thermomicrobiales bacterium]